MSKQNTLTISAPASPITIPVPVSPALKADLEHWAASLGFSVAELVRLIVKTQAEQWQYYRHLSAPQKGFQEVAHLN